MQLPGRLALLQQLRIDLADNLTAMGVTSRRDETLETLIPRVLQISRDTAGSFVASLRPEWDISQGVFTTGEIVYFSGLVTVTQAVRIASLTVNITGSGVSSLAVSGAGWSITKAGNTIRASYTAGRVLSAPEIQDAVGLLQASGDGATAVQATVSMSVQSDSGGSYPASGTAQFVYAYKRSWAMVRETYPTYGDAAGKTWDELGTFEK